MIGLVDVAAIIPANCIQNKVVTIARNQWFKIKMVHHALSEIKSFQKKISSGKNLKRM